MEKQKLCIVTDAWSPQVNGVVTTLTNLVEQAKRNGWEVLVLHPGMFKNFSAPRYKEIKLSIPYKLKQKIKKFNPDHLHIATEGPLGIAARISFRRISYTTAYHTQWAGFLYDILKIPKSLTWWYVRWFHQHGKVMVPTPSIQKELIENGVKSEVVLFGRGVDLSKLKPTVQHIKTNKPKLLNVGRVSVEKNLDVFCNLDPNKYDLTVVGDGPYLKELKQRYPHIRFTGMLFGEQLANEYIMADCMVFTSVKDTFGIVIIESQCMGTPVAAYPVNGPIDVIVAETGTMDKDINKAIENALLLNREKCSKTVRNIYSWDLAWNQFKSNLVKHN